MEHTWEARYSGYYDNFTIMCKAGRVGICYTKGHADLIAAAPDLLEACEATLYIEHPDSDTVTMLKAAIALANGKSLATISS